MKLNNFSFGVIIFCAISVFNCDALAQSKLISSQEFIAGTTKKFSNVFERSRRVESITETISDGVVQKTVLNIYDYLHPARTRIYIKTTAGEKVSETEQIFIDHMRYDRKDGGAWMQVDMRQLGAGVSTGMGAGTPQSCDEYSVEPVILNGMSMQLFERLSVDGNGKELLFTALKKWIGEDGFPYRTESTKGKLFPRDERQRLVMSYEYDPSIKIEAPIK